MPTSKDKISTLIKSDLALVLQSQTPSATPVAAHYPLFQVQHIDLNSQRAFQSSSS